MERSGFRIAKVMASLNPTRNETEGGKVPQTQGVHTLSWNLVHEFNLLNAAEHGGPERKVSQNQV